MSILLKYYLVELFDWKCWQSYNCACSEVDNNVDEEDGVGDAVEHDPAHGEVIVEEGDGDRQDDQVRHQQ